MRIVYSWIQKWFSQLQFFYTGSETWHLTIDDGPSPNTLWILDLLDTYNTKAIFFCIGKNIEAYPDFFNEILKRGHQVGYHSYSHTNVWRQNNQEFVRDFEKCEAIFKSIIYRPPYGKMTWYIYQYLKKKGIKIVLWDVLTEDWKMNIDPMEKIKSKIKQAKNGSIFVFHDNEKSFQNLKIMLPYYLMEMR